MIVWLLTASELAQLMFEAQGHDQLQRILESVGVSRRECAGSRRRPQARDRGGAGYPGLDAGQPGEIDDRDDPAVLEVQASAMLAAVLDHEAAEEAGGGPVRQREAGEHTQECGVARREAESVGDRGAGVDPPYRPAVDEDRG